MDVFDAVRTLLAVRSYQPKPVPADVVRRIVEAGRLTGSAKNAQPWHFIVVQERATLDQLASLARSGPYLSQAPLAIVIVIEKSRFAVSDASRAVQSMLLTAWGAGVGSNLVTFSDPEGVKRLLGIPEELDVMGVLPFGYPVEELGQGIKKRKELSEVAHRERFDQPFA